MPIKKIEICAFTAFAAILLFLGFQASAGDKVVVRKQNGIMPEFIQRKGTDVNSDAPWRVEDTETRIPVSFFVRDLTEEGVRNEQLDYVEVCVYRQPYVEGSVALGCKQKEIRLPLNRSIANTTIDTWEETLWMTAKEFSFSAGQNIFLRTTVMLSGLIESSTGSFRDTYPYRKQLRVHVGDAPLPRPNGGGWYYGDAQVHSEYTNNPYRFGGTLVSMKNALDKMGLDWIMITDPASNYTGTLAAGYRFGSWDLSDPEVSIAGSAWKELQARSQGLNNSLNGLPFIIGEEISTQSKSAQSDQIQKITLLSYNHTKFIPGTVNEGLRPLFGLSNRLQEMTSQPYAFAYAAYPAREELSSIVGSIVPWSTKNYQIALSHRQFAGLQVWSGKHARKTPSTSVKDNQNVNPFDKDGNFGELFDVNWPVEHQRALNQWSELIGKNLKPVRKIFISAGSDAYGDLNYSELGVVQLAWSDNALGKVRTLVYSPLGKDSPSFLQALRNGRSVVTDGPVMIFGMDRDNDQQIRRYPPETINPGKDIIIGDHTILVPGERPKFLVEWKSTPEFTDSKTVSIWNIVRIDPDGSQYKEEDKILSGANLEGSLEWEESQALKPGSYAYRLYLVLYDTSNPAGWRFKHACYTNPIWVTVSETASIQATPSPCRIAVEKSTCITDLQVLNPNQLPTQIWVSTGGRAEQQFTGTLSLSSYQISADWITVEPATFYLYEMTLGGKKLLATTVTRGLAGPLLTASPLSCQVAVDTQLCSTRWEMQNPDGMRVQIWAEGPDEEKNAITGVTEEKQLGSDYLWIREGKTKFSMEDVDSGEVMATMTVTGIPAPVPAITVDPPTCKTIAGLCSVQVQAFNPARLPVQIWVQDPKGQEVALTGITNAEKVPESPSEIPWIGVGTYTFILYDVTGESRRELARATVTGLLPPDNETFVISPSVCTIFPETGRCSVRFQVGNPGRKPLQMWARGPLDDEEKVVSGIISEERFEASFDWVFEGTTLLYLYDMSEGGKRLLLTQAAVGQTASTALSAP